MCVSVSVCIQLTFFSLFPWSGWAINSECKIEQADFTDRCPSYLLTSWRKPALIQESPQHKFLKLFIIMEKLKKQEFSKYKFSIIKWNS